MKVYAHYGFEEFFIALGYKSEVIKRYFLDYYSLNGSMTVNLRSGEASREEEESEDWTVPLIDTGPPDSLAHHESLRALRLRGVLHRARLQERGHQALLPGLLQPQRQHDRQ